MHEVRIIADSLSEAGARLTTFQLRYWLAIHAELLTHRMFSRNAASNRAIPTEILLAQVWNSPAGPEHWGVNQAGMQARAELVGWRRALAGGLWRTAAKFACAFAWGLAKVGLHKQAANRVLMPFQYISVIVSATDWDNFWTLRCHPDAQPEFQSMAQEMKQQYDASCPLILRVGEWHLPYVSDDELEKWGGRTDPHGILRKLSTARNARVSFLTHDKKKPSVLKDIGLHDKLVVATPIHASPAEHVARALMHPMRRANFNGWSQYRLQLEAGLPPAPSKL